MRTGWAPTFHRLTVTTGNNFLTVTGSSWNVRQLIEHRMISAGTKRRTFRVNRSPRNRLWFTTLNAHAETRQIGCVSFDLVDLEVAHRLWIEEGFSFCTHSTNANLGHGELCTNLILLRPQRCDPWWFFIRFTSKISPSFKLLLKQQTYKHLSPPCLSYACFPPKR